MLPNTASEADNEWRCILLWFHRGSYLNNHQFPILSGFIIHLYKRVSFSVPRVSPLPFLLEVTS